MVHTLLVVASTLLGMMSGVLIALSVRTSVKVSRLYKQKADQARLASPGSAHLAHPCGRPCSVSG